MSRLWRFMAAFLVLGISTSCQDGSPTPVTTATKVLNAGSEEPKPDTIVGGKSPTPRPSASVAQFTDASIAAGVTQPYVNGADGQFRLVETMGSGAGLIDYDRDGWLDLYVLQGRPLPEDGQPATTTARLYRNQRDGSFRDVTEAANVGFHGYGQGVAVGDYDGDGHDDLFAAGFGRSALYRNSRSGRFEDVTVKAGLHETGWASSCAFADLDGDGDLDLYVVHYLADTVDSLGNPTARCNATPGKLGYCPPDAFRPEGDHLYKNNGDGTFTDVSAESGIGRVAGNGLGLAIADLDDDGRLDIFVANDRTPNLCFHNQGGLRFEETALAWGLAYNEAGQLRAGMGVAAGDADGDERLDLLVTNFYEEGVTLYLNKAPRRFQVGTAQARLLSPTRGRLGFGVGFLDADLDGDLDLFIANGHVNDARSLNIPYKMSAQLLQNMGDCRYEDVSSHAGPYFQGSWLGRAAAIGDLDNDGDEDVVATHLDRPPALLRNETARTPGTSFLQLSLRGANTSRTAIGARVSLEFGGRVIVRQLVAGTSYLSTSDSGRRLTIGLGRAEKIDRLVIRWPSGKEQVQRNVVVPARLTIDEPTPGE